MAEDREKISTGPNVGADQRARLPAPARAFRTMRWHPGEELPQPPSDEEVEKVAQAMNAPGRERDTLPLEGE